MITRVVKKEEPPGNIGLNTLHHVHRAQAAATCLLCDSVHCNEY